MIAPFTFVDCTSDSCASPVPGGMSTTKKSSSPQATSRTNCVMIFMMIGPRQMAGCSFSMRKPRLITFTPCATSGMIFSSMTEGG